MTGWRLIAEDGARAARGLAMDEALLAAVGRDAARHRPTLRLYTYADHAALVGRYQTLDAEIDLAACAATGTGVSRRPTGGGAIVMGVDQLGVALVLPAPSSTPKMLIRELSEGVVAGLRRLGVAVAFGGKNDLLAGARKIAGLGLYLDGRGGLLFHASVLGDLDVPFMLRVLNIPAAKLAGKGVAAVEDRITTVARETGGPIPTDDLRTAVAAGFAERFGVRLEPGDPTDVEQAAADELVATRYAHPDWLHHSAARPEGTGSALLRGPEGLVRVYVAAQGSLVKNVLFAGDFNTLPDGLRRLEALLRWRHADGQVVRELVAEAGAATPAGEDLGWSRDEDVVAAVLAAAADAAERAAAQPIRPVGSCYFPEPVPRSAVAVPSRESHPRSRP